MMPDLSGVAYLAMLGAVALAALIILVPGVLAGGLWWLAQPRLGLPWDGVQVGFGVSIVAALPVALVVLDVFRR